jgi:Protein of unknown function (DUF2950)
MAKQEGDRSNGEPARRKKRFRSCAAAFLVLTALIIGTPVTIGLVTYYRQRAEEQFVEVFRNYGRAQGVYHGRDRDGDKKLEYCRRLGGLVDVEKQLSGNDVPPETPVKERPPLVSSELAAARGSKGQPFRGYLFLEMNSIWKIDINWEGDFALCAIPAEYGKTGRKTYIMKTDGDVYWKDLGESQFLKNYPQDLEGKGWTKFGEKQQEQQ